MPTFAAVDIGSNSVRLKIARLQRHRLREIHEDREVTRLGEGVFDGGMKQVALFDYNQRANAEQKLTELLGKQKGTYFLQVVKQPIPEPEPVA